MMFFPASYAFRNHLYLYIYSIIQQKTCQYTYCILKNPLPSSLRSILHMINFSDVRRLNEAQPQNVKTGYDRLRLMASLSPQLVKYVYQMVKTFPFSLPFSPRTASFPFPAPHPSPAFAHIIRKPHRKINFFPATPIFWHGFCSFIRHNHKTNWPAVIFVNKIINITNTTRGVGKL